MTLRLHVSPTSPYVRKVLVVLHETGRIGEVETVRAGGTPLDTSRMPLAANPLGKIPVLERPDAPALYDSRVICRFFGTGGGSRLYPDGARLWDALTLESTADGMMDAAAAMVYETRLHPPEAINSDLIEGWWTKISRCTSALNERWMGHLNGGMDIGHVAVAVALGYADFRHAARDWRAGAPDLAAWYAGFAQRPSMLATAPAE